MAPGLPRSGLPCGVCVEVRAVRGSSPREIGARMLVRPDGFEGTIGGGQLEHTAIARARDMLADWVSGMAPVADDVETRALGPQLSQCCGGVVTLAYTPWFALHLPPPPPLFHLQLHGAGHVGRALLRALRDVPCVIDWVDLRTDAFPPTVPERIAATVNRHRIDDPEAMIEAAPSGCMILVMTHSHPLDFAICEAALRRADLPCVGLIGSATKRAKFELRCRRHGVSAERIDRLICPIGIPGIPGKQPEVLAVAVAAQLLVLAGNPVPARHAGTLAEAEHSCAGCPSASTCGAS
ncbi:MAG TPA: xanthine dehydrogenase accessory protein XdhC [Acidiphilium sp.]